MANGPEDQPNEDLLGLGGAADEFAGPDATDRSPPVSAYTSEKGFKEVSAAELWSRFGPSADAADAFDAVIDVRTPEEFGAGAVPGSVNVPMEGLSAMVKAGELDAYRGKRVAMVCGSGLRSAQATVRLSRLFGFGDVHNVAGGIIAWTDGGLELE